MTLSRLVYLYFAAACLASAQGFVINYTAGGVPITVPAPTQTLPLTFTGVPQGTANAASQTVVLVPTGAPLIVLISVNNPELTPWLQLDHIGPLNLSGRFDLGVSINTANVGPGNYSGSFQVANFPPIAPGVFVNVSLSVSATGAVRVTTVTLPQGTQGVPYTYGLAATGGSPPYLWSIFSGSLAQGLALSSTGLISGTPAGQGLSSFSVRVADSTSALAFQNLALTINPQVNLQPPVISSLNPSSASVGAAGLTVTVTGSGFTSSSVVRWNGISLATSFSDATLLRAAVPANLITSAGVAAGTQP